MKAYALILIKLVGLLLLYVDVNPEKWLSTFLLLLLINLWLLRDILAHRPFIKLTFIIDALALFLTGSGALIGLIILSEVFSEWLKNEQHRRLDERDELMLRLYNEEHLLVELMASQQKIEQLTKVAERARISAEIHDHAGHDIMGAYMALQLLAEESQDELFEEAVVRLGIGVEKIRQAVHNMKPEGNYGIETLYKIVEVYKKPSPEFKVFGDFEQINQFQFSIIEAVLKEGLTNISKHANPTGVKIELTITPTLVHFKMENDGVNSRTEMVGGIGMKNLKRRTESAGGTFIKRREGDRFIVMLTMTR